MLSGQEVLRLLIVRKEEVVLAPMVATEELIGWLAGAQQGCVAQGALLCTCVYRYYYFRHDDHRTVHKRSQNTF